MHCRGIGHAAGTKPLFNDLSIAINEGDKIGLVGHNGSGKTTLLSILSGEVSPDSGDISRRKGLSLETVEQFLTRDLIHDTLLDCLLKKLTKEERDFSSYKAEKLLLSLGFSHEEFAFSVGDLSGGQQNRLMFARAVINEPNLILFDEPTNHLDMKTLVFFEQYLQVMKTAFLIISHDRRFLDAVTHKTVFLRDQRLYEFSLPYSDAKLELEAQDAAAEQRLKAEEKNIKRLTESAKRLATWGKVYDNEKFAAKAKTIEKRVEKLESEKTFVTRGSGLHLTIDMQESRANRALQVENYSVCFSDNTVSEQKPLFEIDEFYLKPGDRVALLGHNGAGKTTLIQHLVKAYRAQESNHIRFNPQCELGYYDQELEHLDPEHSLLESIRSTCSKGNEAEYKAGLIHAGFEYKDHDKKIKVLSGGEKARLMFLSIRINLPSFLILDEPTNHIDIQGKEELEKQLLSTNATLLITSHDRTFVDNIATRHVVIKNRQLVEVNSPNEFYRDIATAQQNTDQPLVVEEKPALSDEEDMLRRLLELEQKLSDDLARKPKFQKPNKQAEWKHEISSLQKELGLDQ